MKANNTLTYKNFTGTVEYSSEYNLLFGKIIGVDEQNLAKAIKDSTVNTKKSIEELRIEISNMITYYGKSIDEIKAGFEKAVDDYISFCVKTNQTPYRTYKGSFNIRISPELHKALAEDAEIHGLTLNATVEKAISQYITTD